MSYSNYYLLESYLHLIQCRYFRHGTGLDKGSFFCFDLYFQTIYLENKISIILPFKTHFFKNYLQAFLLITL